MQLSGRTILVTGGSAGIGLGFAAAFLELGNTVVITGRSQEKLDAAKAAHPGLHALVCDAADPDAVAALGRTMRERFPALDLLFNNAGVLDYRNLRTGAEDLVELTRELEVNVAGPIRTVSVLVDQLRENRGAIVNVSSGLAFVPLQAAPIYCATKAAMHSYTLSLRQQLRGQVEVVELMPPAVRTEMTADMPEGSFSMFTTEELVQATLPKLRAGATEIRPGMSNQLHWMNRIAPGFIRGQLEKGSAALVPE